MLASEAAREGRDERRIGTLFVIGDSGSEIGSSKTIIPHPLAGHLREVKQIADLDVRETLKELAQLVGALVVSGAGVVISAARYVDTNSEGLNGPLGLGSRHMAAASVSKRMGA